MLLIFDKIIQQKQEIFQIFIENKNQWGASEDKLFYIYIKLINQKINPNWNIFKIIFPILQKKEMDIIKIR